METGTGAKRAGKESSGRPVRWWLSLGIAGVFFAGGYLAAAQWIFPGQRGVEGGDLVRVPELVGLTEEDAQGRLERQRLEYVVRSGVSHPRAPEGAVLAQSPLPGQYARPGAPVHVTLSRGPERHAMPDVAGLSERQATIVLERLGFTVQVERETHTLDPGRAVSTKPEAGTELPVPTDVILVVSEGRPVATVPDLRGRHIDDAEGVLSEAGFELGATTYDPAALEAPGRIIGQYPPAGFSLRQGGRVEVRVAGDVERVDRTREWFDGDGGEG
jgi:serine/threonine-protein kinase